MTLTQDQILSLAFVATDLEAYLSVSDINNFLELLYCNTNFEHYNFFMPMYDDFNQELFAVSKDNKFYIKRLKPATLLEIYNIAKNSITNSFQNKEILNAINENKLLYISRKNAKNSI